MTRKNKAKTCENGQKRVMNGPKQATNGSWAPVPLGWPAGPGGPTPGLPHEESKVRSIREKHDSRVAPERKPALGKNMGKLHITWIS